VDSKELQSIQMDADILECHAHNCKTNGCFAIDLEPIQHPRNVSQNDIWPPSSTNQCFTNSTDKPD
jgi:hypothetical protein